MDVRRRRGSRHCKISMVDADAAQTEVLLQRLMHERGELICGGEPAARWPLGRSTTQEGQLLLEDLLYCRINGDLSAVVRFH